MTYLVTGGGGFVGRAVVAALIQQGADVTLLTRAGSRSSVYARRPGVAEVSISDLAEVPDAVAKAAPDVVVHLAAQQLRSPRGAADLASLIEANITLGAFLLDGVQGTGAVVVQAMSYFQFRDGRPAPHSFYSATKEGLRAIGEYYRERLGVDVRDVVLFDNYGPGDTRDKLVPALAEAVATGGAVTVGPLDQPIDLLHVEDVARGLLAAAGHGVEPLTTLRAARPTTVGEVISLLERAAGRSLNYEVDATRVSSDHPLHAGDWPAPPGWAPEISLERGLAQLVGA